MLKKLLLATCLTSILYSADNEIDIYGFGLSYHTNREVNYNGENYGLGLGYSRLIEKDSSTLSYLTCVGGVYKDSYNDTARFLMPGVRFQTVGDWHASIGINGGYFDGSGFRGIGFIPFGSVGYKRFDICVTCSPNTNGPQNSKSSAPEDNRATRTGLVGVFIKYTIVEW